MNQYLLLRNNKKSGPFSAAELASMGLKPFDLIWLEGKSAAWRYPGEIDELKSFAPPVEEQPYDRFYNKKPKDQPASFEPQVQDTIKKPEPSPEHPGQSVQKHEPSLQKTVAPTFSHAHVDSGKEKNFKQRIFVAVPESKTRKEDPIPVIQLKENAGPKNDAALTLNTETFQPAKTNFRIIYWSVAAMIIFAIATTFIYINYQEQEKQLKKLNELVLNMQQNQTPETNPLSKNVVATFPIDATAVMHDSLKTEMTLVPESEKIPAKKIPVKKKPFRDSSVLHTSKTDSISQPVELPEKNIIEEKPSLRKEINKKNIGELVKLSTNKYKVGLLGGVSDLKLTLTNKSQVTFDKVEVQLEFLGPENKVVKTQVVNFENVASGSAMTLDIPRSGRGVSVKYNIASIQKADEVIALF